MDLSAEDLEGGKCGLLKKAAHGTCDAAQNLEMEYVETISQNLERVRVWTGSAESFNGVWR